MYNTCPLCPSHYSLCITQVHCVHHTIEEGREFTTTDIKDRNTVINLSGATLSTEEIKLLSRGLSLYPKPLKVDHFLLKEDLVHFFRSLRPAEFFYDSEETENQNPYPFKSKSKWTPPCNRDPALETDIKVV